MRWRRYNAAIAPIALQIAPANRPLHATNMHSMHTTRTTTTAYYYYSRLVWIRTLVICILYHHVLVQYPYSSNNNTTSCTARINTTYSYSYINTQNESTYSSLVAVRTQFLQTPIVRASALIYDSYYSTSVVLLFNFFALLRDRIVWSNYWIIAFRARNSHFF